MNTTISVICIAIFAVTVMVIDAKFTELERAVCAGKGAVLVNVPGSLTQCAKGIELVGRP